MKKLVKFVFNFKEREELFQTKFLNWKQKVKWHLARGMRNTTIVLSFALTGFLSTTIYNYFYPVKTMAEVKTEKEIVEVPVHEFPPILQKICLAESGGKQFNKDGSVYRGAIDKSDIGFCMINERYNNDYARKLGFCPNFTSHTTNYCIFRIDTIRKEE